MVSVVLVDVFDSITKTWDTGLEEGIEGPSGDSSLMLYPLDVRK